MFCPEADRPFADFGPRSDQRRGANSLLTFYLLTLQPRCQLVGEFKCSVNQRNIRQCAKFGQQSPNSDSPSTGLEPQRIL